MNKPFPAVPSNILFVTTRTSVHDLQIIQIGRATRPQTFAVVGHDFAQGDRDLKIYHVTDAPTAVSKTAEITIEEARIGLTAYWRRRHDCCRANFRPRLR